MEEDQGRWPTKVALARELRLSERTLERKIERGEVRSALRAVPGKKSVTIVHPVDAARLRAERVTAVPAPRPRPRAPHDFGALVTLLAEALAAALGPPRPLPTATAGPVSLWLSLKQARAVSGLPASILREACRAEHIVCIRRGRRYYICRASLEAFRGTTQAKG